MPITTVDFSFKKEPGNGGYSIHIDNTFLSVTNHKAIVDIETDVDHRLEWEIAGNGGDKLTIVGKVGEKQVVKSIDSIPPDHTSGFGQNIFNIVSEPEGGSNE